MISDGEIQQRLLAAGYSWDGERAGRRKRTQDEIIAFYRRDGKPPSSNSLDVKERILGAAFQRYTGKTKEGHDPLFVERICQEGWKYKEDRRKESEENIVAFFETHKRTPSLTNPEEVKLAKDWNAFQQKRGPRFNPKLLERMKEKGYKNRAERRAELQEEIREFFRNKKRGPSTLSKNPEERSLGLAFRAFVSLSARAGQDPKFTRSIEAEGLWSRGKTKGRKSLSSKSKR